MSGFAIVIIVIALGMIVGNIMLLKHSAKFSMKNLKQEPIENSKNQMRNHLSIQRLTINLQMSCRGKRQAFTRNR
ncbi:DUF2897 family protein [Psychrosphaera algicola]|uniref:DUF2897 family protein n=1 Tax=Psychrosphaera algicola TaxID=3023714 RepID=A0ABT5F9T3_9GAMM|nr:DUF2897 family protein [Psychrosphaera sp. G1-22]MDC2887814.1 DUF2897 family protein [Psychrosphaera sp. G1-22]